VDHGVRVSKRNVELAVRSLKCHQNISPTKTKFPCCCGGTADFNRIHPLPFMMNHFRTDKARRCALQLLKRFICWHGFGALAAPEVKGEIHSFTSADDLIELEKIRQKLSQKYPADWLERDGTKLYGWTLAGCGSIYLIVAIICVPWWNLLIPVMVPPLFVRLLPIVLFGRDPARPRWAHECAVLEGRDVMQVDRIVRPMPLDQRMALTGYCPATTGIHFSKIWRYVHGYQD